jgi:hypothetical protein
LQDLSPDLDPGYPTTLRILVADDEPTSRLLMQAALRESGFAVTLACGCRASPYFSRRSFLDEYQLPFLKTCHLLPLKAMGWIVDFAADAPEFHVGGQSQVRPTAKPMQIQGFASKGDKPCG